MNESAGFHLLDCLLALFLVAVGLMAALGLSVRAQQQLARYRRHMAAWTIVSNAMHEPIARLAAYPRRDYDVQGGPTTPEGAVFTLEIQPDTWAGGVVYRGRLAYVDLDGFERERTFSRFEGR